MGERTEKSDASLARSQSLGFTVGLLLCLILSVVFAAGVWRRAVAPPGSIAAGRINPNDASASSLARLPGIGPARARAIVVFRDDLQRSSKDRPIFRRAEDLAQVKGIGPTTVEAVRPWLRFDPISEGRNELLAR